MSRFLTINHGLFLVIISAASHSFSDHVVDSIFDDDRNEFEYYWFYYDDNFLPGPDNRPQAAPESTPSVIDVAYEEHERNGYDGHDLNDTLLIKKYYFATTEHLGRKCATMPFTFGEPWEAGYCSAGRQCAMPYVGIGTILTIEHGGIDLTGTAGFCFCAKTRVQELSEVRFIVRTLDIKFYDES